MNQYRLKAFPRYAAMRLKKPTDINAGRVRIEFMSRKILSVWFFILLISSSYVIAEKSTSNSNDFEEMAIAPSKVRWIQTNGPPGGRINKLIQNPYHHNELYALVGSRVYESRDKGEHWRLINELRNVSTTSIAPFEDKLFLCGAGVYCFDKLGNLVKILDGWFGEVTVSDNKLFATGSRPEREKGIEIQYTDLTSTVLDWEDISPSLSELKDLTLPPADIGFSCSVRASNIVAIGNRILASIVLEVNGRQDFDNGYLYASENLGESWSRVDLDMGDRLKIATLIQHPEDPQHLLLSLKHTLGQEFTSPLFKLMKESYDGGRTWGPVTNITLESSAVTDIDIVQSLYYLACPFNAGIVKLNGSEYELIPMPRLEEFKEIPFSLTAIVFDFDNPNTVYGTTDVWAYGIFKSEDTMVTWRKIDRDIIASAPYIVLAHPMDANTIFTSGNAVQEKYLTRDGGKTWKPFSPCVAGDELKIDPHDPNHIILIDEMTNLWESYDRGNTFQKINKDFSSAKVFDFDIAKDNPDKIYVSNIGIGISRYLASQRDWQYLTYSPDYAYVIRTDPQDTGTLYATYSPKKFENYSSIWRFSEYQMERFGWSEILRVENSKGIVSLEFDKLNPNRIYAGVVGKRGTIYVSNDRGNTWEILNKHFIMNTVWGQSQLIVDPNDPSIAYAATWLAGTWKTTDAGETWELLGNAPISSTALSPNLQDTNIIYLADRSSPTVWKSMDTGKTWEKIANFASDGALLVMRVLADGDNVYASTFLPSLQGGRLYRSTDAGATWSDTTGTLPKGILDIAVDPTNSNILYVTTNIHGAYKSTDGGVTWMEMRNLPYLGAYDIEIDPENPEILHIAARGGSLPSWFTEIAGEPKGIVFEDSAGVYRSTDGGLTWSKILTTTASCRAIRRHPDNPNLLFAPDIVDGLLVSVDGGSSWTAVREGLDSAVVTSVAVNNDKIYVGTQGCGVYSGDLDVSTGKITWQPSRSNKPVPEVYSLQIGVDPTNSNNIFVGSNPGGLYVSNNGGITFKDRNAITPSVVVDDPVLQGYYTFAIDPSNPKRMWIGTWGKGIYKSYDAMLLDVPAGLFGKHIRKIVIDPSNPDNVYVATKEGIFVTRDEGKTWEDMNEGLETLDIWSLKFTHHEWSPFQDGFDDGNADGWRLENGWSVTQENGNYVLQGIGHNFAEVGLDAWNNYVFEAKIKLIHDGLHVNFRRSSEARYFLGIGEGDYGLRLHKHFDYGKGFAYDLATSVGPYGTNQWYRLKVELKGNNIKVYIDDTLKINYTDPDPILHGAVAFETLESSQILVDDVSVEIEAKDTLWAGTAGYGIYQFDLADGKWQNLGRTLGSGWWSAWERRMYQFSSILFDPTRPSRVYLGHFPSGFFISEDNGHTWKDSSLGLGNDGIFSLTMDPHNSSIIWAGTYNGVVKSIDGGRTWKSKNNGIPPEQWPYTVAIDKNSDIMYVSTKNGQNKGFGHRNKFCGVVMKSIDKGETWFKIMNGLDNRSEFYNLLIHPLNHNILFLSSNNGVYVSNDAGLVWHSINNELPTTYNQVRDNVAEVLALTPDNKYLILGLNDYGVWKADISLALNRIPTASFSYSPSEPTAQVAVNFYDSSQDVDGSIASWSWEFGDGSNSTDRNPTHSYSQAGVYSVKLTVLDNDEGKNSTNKPLTVVARSPTFTETPLGIGIIGGLILLVISATFVIARKRKHSNQSQQDQRMQT